MEESRKKVVEEHNKSVSNLASKGVKLEPDVHKKLIQYGNVLSEYLLQKFTLSDTIRWMIIHLKDCFAVDTIRIMDNHCWVIEIIFLFLIDGDWIFSLLFFLSPSLIETSIKSVIW